MSSESKNAQTVSDNKSAVNFYILSDSDLQQRLLFVFRLVEKARQQRLKTLIIASDDEQLAALDKLLWTEKPERFIAHEIITDKTTQPLPPVLLTTQIKAISAIDFLPQVVIDLSYDATPIDFPKIMLIANQHPDVLPNARLKYQAYVNQGIKPNVHKL